MDTVREVINYFATISPYSWQALGAFLAGSTVIAGLLQIVKHKLQIADAKKLIMFLLGFFSFLASFADFVIQQNAVHPLPDIGKLTVALIGGATVLHRFAVSPAYYKIVAKLTALGAWLDGVKAYQASQKSTTIPVAQLPGEADLVQFEV